jgi:hypothetical protein
MIVLQRVRYAVPKKTQKTLKITIPENFSYHNAFADIFERFGIEAEHVKTRTTDLGSFFELTFNVTASDHIDEKALLDELRTRNGNLPVILVLREIKQPVY